MRKILFVIAMFMVILCQAQPGPGAGFRPMLQPSYGTQRPVWVAQQPSYYNSSLERNVNVFVTKVGMPGSEDMSEMVIFDIAGEEITPGVYKDRQTIMFFDIPKLLGALDVCAEAFSEVQTLSRRAKNALIEGMDTIFPRAAILWMDADTLVGSYNNVLRPDIKIDNGQVKLIITGTALCRVKFNDTMNDPEFSGDENVKTDWSLVFSSAKEVNELAACISSSVSERNRIPTPIRPQHAFPRVFDRNLNQDNFNGFMRRWNPTWDPEARPFSPVDMRARMRR